MEQIQVGDETNVQKRDDMWVLRRMNAKLCLYVSIPFSALSHS